MLVPVGDIQTVSTASADSPSIVTGHYGLIYSRVTCTLAFGGTGRLPRFLGPTLRGGLGIHLKRTICHARRSDCNSCLLQADCLYRYLFDGVAPPERDFMRLYPYIPQPFAIQVGLLDNCQISPGRRLDFTVALFGKAVDYFPYILYSLSELGKAGLGKDRIPFELVRVQEFGQAATVYEKGSRSIGRLQRRPLTAEGLHADYDELLLEFVTPCRIRVAGQYARRLRFEDIVRSAARRISILQRFYGQPTSLAIQGALQTLHQHEVKITMDQTHWYGFDRFSNRQGRSIPMGGLVGRMAIGGRIKPFVGLLEAAQIVNVGKATSFGFGYVRLCGSRDNQDGQDAS